MSNAIDKAKLLEWLNVEIDLSHGEHEVLRADKWAFEHIKTLVESGRFDLPADHLDLDDLDMQHRFMHERNERLEKELAEARAEIERLRGKGQ